MNGGSPQQASEQALNRIEAAMQRLERAAKHLAGDRGLRQRHARLRAAVSESLRELDALLAARPDAQPDAQPDAAAGE